ncbi:CAAX protease [Cephaloticoccus primus]|uniref:CAAX protease n=1 Tax=Cephaloticoccus primus TaxID=1548207 RepID=A0A139SHN2_9BACT|nr:CAAX protease [Cephaloticoccus primus]
MLIDELISVERIRSYEVVFHPADDAELMGVYLWNAHVCGALYPLISAVEVSLRNAIDHALMAELGEFWWVGNRLRYRSFGSGNPPPQAMQVIRANFTKATNSYIIDQRRRHKRRGRVEPLHNDVIGKTEFSTWQFMLDAEFLGRGLIWPKLLSIVFRGPWPTRQASVLLTRVRGLVFMLREFRNRLFHNEPAWKGYGVKSEADALAHLQEQIRKVEGLLALIHPECLRLLRLSGLLRAAQRACTQGAIRRFQRRL